MLLRQAFPPRQNQNQNQSSGQYSSDQGQGQNAQNQGGQVQGQGGQAGQGTTNANGLPWGAPFPSLHLWPLQDTFVMKMIHLPEGQRIKIGRQTNNKTVPGERNAYFDSKVLSRLHAEIWEQGGKIFIKDVRSSNGTFINGERLSPESVESAPFELKSEDQVEFGIDIVSEDNRTIVHHKVAAKVYCVFGPEDAALSARELVNYQNPDSRGLRRVASQPNGHPNNQLSQMGPSIMSSGGKSSALSFDSVLNKLQNELRASKETGAELQNLATAFTDIQDTLGGGLPPSQNGSAAQYIPPQFRSASAEAQAALAGPHGQQAAAFIALQNQLTETQTSLGSQLEKIRLLEGQLKEHETIKHELSSMREQMEESKREMELLLAGHRGRQMGRRIQDDDDDDDDDARSVMTLMDSEDAEQRVRERRKAEREGGDERRSHRQPDRPRTPEPSNLNGDPESDEEDSLTSASREGSQHAQVNGDVGSSPSRVSEIEKQNAELVLRIQTLSAEIAEAVLLSKTLQSQHSEAMSAVKILTEKVGTLEDGIAGKIAEEMSKAEQKWDSWRLKFEEGWKKERESWDAERERLRGVVREWEEASRRAHEEEEDRELNESLSEDEQDDEDEEDEDEDDDDDVQNGAGPDGVLSIDGWEEGAESSGRVSISPSRKPRRRRPSQKAILAVKALKSLAVDDTDNANSGVGSSTPKGTSPTSPSGKPSTSISTSLAGTTSALAGAAEARGNNSNGKLRSHSRSKRSLGLSKRRDDITSRSGLSRTIGPDDNDAKDKDKENSSESGRESVSTLKEGGEGGDETDVGRPSGVKGNKDVVQGQVISPVPVFTVLVVLVAAGVYWHKYYKE
ncbi:hypothetical protein I317_01331 [Kwoniella heveanensis CBS 569]|nr:hypothetical protein I317_01331 [Kwoniella heveanensis CBS 569]